MNKTEGKQVKKTPVVVTTSDTICIKSTVLSVAKLLLRTMFYSRIPSSREAIFVTDFLSLGNEPALTCCSGLEILTSPQAIFRSL